MLGGGRRLVHVIGTALASSVGNVSASGCQPARPTSGVGQVVRKTAVSFPKIISGHNGGAAQTRLGWPQ
jgi:hypothetical protein